MCSPRVFAGSKRAARRRAADARAVGRVQRDLQQIYALTRDADPVQVAAAVATVPDADLRAAVSSLLGSFHEQN